MRIPMGWERCEISDVLATQDNGKLLKQGWSPKCETHPALTDSDWGVLKTTSIQSGSFLGDHNKALPDSLQPRPGLQVAVDDLLLTCAGPRSRCGVPCLVRSTRPRLMISGKMYKMRASPQVLPAFAEAWLLTSEAQKAVDQMKTGGSDSGLNLTQGRFLRLPFLLAPLPEQRRIVAKIESLFTSLDEGLAALKRAEANLARYHAAVLKSAVEGRLTKRWRKANPPKESGEELLDRILAERRQRWETEQLAKFEAKRKRLPKNWKQKYKEPVAPDQEELPELPDAWCWATVDQLAPVIQYGHTASADPSKLDGPRFLRITDIQHGRVQWSTVPGCAVSKAETEKYRLNEGDIVFARTGATTGKSYLIEDHPEAIFASYLIRVGLSGLVRSPYISHFFQSGSYWEQIEKGKRGIGQPNVNAQVLARVTLPLPPFAEQVEIARRIASTENTLQQTGRRSLESCLAAASSLRQSILKRAFEGRLVPQDSNDEPASVLLERIRAEQEAEGIRRQRPSKQRRQRKGQVA